MEKGRLFYSTIVQCGSRPSQPPASAAQYAAVSAANKTQRNASVAVLARRACAGARSRQ